jgi:hypothetical protein
VLAADMLAADELVAAGVLAACAAADVVSPEPCTAAAPEQPARARPAATPKAAPNAVSGFFPVDRMSLLPGCVVTLARAPGNTSHGGKSCGRAVATFSRGRPY